MSTKTIDYYNENVNKFVSDTHIGAENFIGCYSLNKISVSESFYGELVASMRYFEVMRYPN